MQDEHLIAVTILVTLVILLLWEMWAPRRPTQTGTGWRWANNLSLTVIGQLSAHAVNGPAALLTAWLAQQWGMGLLANGDNYWFATFFLYMLALEAVTYGVHLASHKVRWMWRIHSVHHSDTELDFSSAYRHHPFEMLLILAATLPVTVLLAPPLSVVAVYMAIRAAILLPGHANIYIPARVDRFLRTFLVTPDFHRLHHCSDRRYTDSNYGTILPWFDYLFGTASRRPFAEQATMEIGLEYARAPRDSRIDALLLMPFRRFDGQI